LFTPAGGDARIRGQESPLFWQQRECADMALSNRSEVGVVQGGDLGDIHSLRQRDYRRVGSSEREIGIPRDERMNTAQVAFCRSEERRYRRESRAAHTESFGQDFVHAPGVIGSTVHRFTDSEKRRWPRAISFRLGKPSPQISNGCRDLIVSKLLDQLMQLVAALGHRAIVRAPGVDTASANCSAPLPPWVDHPGQGLGW
jgi:hypothetical protein